MDKIKKPRKKKGTGLKRYFTEETEQAIIDYNNTEDQFKRNRLYKDHIMYAFDKLAENLIHTFKFYYFDVPYIDVKHEVVAFLQEKIHKFKAEKGKAFSYFSIVAKNYLIIRNNANYNKFKNTEKVESIDSSRNIIGEVSKQNLDEECRDFIDLYVEYWDRNMTNYFSKQKDLVIVDSILELFRTRHNIENYNKKSLYILIRERTGVKTQNITKIVNIMKVSYITMFTNYQKHGCLLPSNKIND